MPQAIDGPVSDDGEEPALDRTLARIVQAARPPCGQERVLDDIFGSGLLPQDLKGKPVSDSTVCVVEALDLIDRL
jgi:hypothetical protein